ncbi:MAG TPA: hypothetical protein VM238_21295 [Phycisphaerae bacterium]|nr:hypothetical protein [Phycisphaerae bacterium]
MTFDSNSVDSQGVGDSLRELADHQDQIVQLAADVDAGQAPEMEAPEVDLPQPVEVSLPEGADPQMQAAFDKLVSSVNQTIEAVKQTAGESALKGIQEVLRQQHEQIAGLAAFVTARQELPPPRMPEGDFGLSAGMAAIDSELQAIRPGHLSGDGIEIIHGGGAIGLGVSEDPFADDGGLITPAVRWAKVKEDWTDAADNEVYAYPCSNSSGANVNTDITLTLYATMADRDYVDYVYAKEDDIVAYLPYEVSGVTYGILVNVTHGGRYTNPQTLPWNATDRGPLGDTWTRDSDTTYFGLLKTVTTRVIAAVNGTIMTLFGYRRIEYYDHAGQLKFVTPEYEYVILAIPCHVGA